MVRVGKFRDETIMVNPNPTDNRTRDYMGVSQEGGLQAPQGYGETIRGFWGPYWAFMENDFDKHAQLGRIYDDEDWIIGRS